MAPIVRALAESGVPVIGHIGFTPQSALQQDRARAQGRSQQRRHSSSPTHSHCRRQVPPRSSLNSSQPNSQR